MPRSRRAGASGALALALGAALLLTGCTPSPEPTPTPTLPAPSGDGVLRIGTLFSTSGPGSASAPGETAGVHAAVRAVNAAGGVDGVPVEVLSRDGGTAGDGAAEAAFAELVERGADVVIGPSTMEVAALLTGPAREAGVPLVTSSARGPRPEGSADVLFRVVGSARAEGLALAADLAAAGAASVAVVRADDPATRELAAGLAEGLAAAETEPIDIVAGADPAADAQQASVADAVVVATGSAGEATTALLSALHAAGVPSGALWLVDGALTRYDAGGALSGAHGIRGGVGIDPALAAAIRQEDPGARTHYAGEAYDAAVLVALAAVVAGDDGGASIAAALPYVAGDGIACASFGECLAVLGDRPGIRYAGATGDLAFGEDSDRVAATFLRYLFDGDDRPVPVTDPAG